MTAVFTEAWREEINLRIFLGSCKHTGEFVCAQNLPKFKQVSLLTFESVLLHLQE